MRLEPIALTAEELFNWVEGEGMRWRHDESLNLETAVDRLFPSRKPRGY